MRASPVAVMASLSLACAGWLLGTALQMHERELPPPAALAVLGVVAVLLALPAAVGWPLWRDSRRDPRATLLRALLWLLAAAVAAYALASMRAQMLLEERLPPALEGRDLVVTGLVAQLPRSSLHGTRFLFDVESARLEEPDGRPGAAVALPSTLSLGWYRMAEPDALLLGPQTEVRAGQRWQLRVRLRQPQADAPNAMTIIDRGMIAASGFRTIPDLFKLVPGMYVSYYKASQPIVSYHGATDQNARRMQVMIDGRSVYLTPGSTVEWSSDFNVNTSSERDVVKTVQEVYQAGLDNLSKLYGFGGR